MNKFDLDINYNLDYLVIVPSKDKDVFEDFIYTFENVILFENTVQDTEFLMKLLRINTIRQLVFVNYYVEYEEIINTLTEEHELKFIFTKSLGELSDSMVLADLNAICDKYDKKAINTIGFLDHNLYEVMRSKRRNVKYLLIDTMETNEDNSENSNTIGLLNSDISNYDSFYNEMSAISFLPNFKAKVLNPSVTSKKFADEFGVGLSEVKDYRELIGENIVNLYINFTGTLPTVFIRSMDKGIPCIIGNNDFLKNYPVLQNYLVIESDDDVDEIRNRIKLVIDDNSMIFEEYKKFRKDYSVLVRELLEAFLGRKVERNDKREFEKLLTVVVPVYNTGRYIKKCLDSIVEAQIPNMEVLVINDGSTDDSENIIERYKEKHPDLIRYIKKKNGGLGSVRNVGLLEARGKYIASVDSDDTIEPEFYSAALAYMKDDIDVVICDWMSASDQESFLTPAVDPVFAKRKEFEGIMYTTIMPSTCNKIMKRELFDDLKYYERKFEDLSINPIALLRARTIKYIRKPYYNYYLRNNSLMRSKINPKEMTDVLALLDSKIKKMQLSISLEEFKYYTYSWRIEEYIINPLYELDGRELSNAINYINGEIYDLMLGVFESDYYKGMVNKLDEEKKNYIISRNKAIKMRKLSDFLKSKKDSRCIVTAGMIYYGN